MFRNRCFLRLFFPNETSFSRKTRTTFSNFHKIALDLRPHRIPVPYRKWHDKLTSAELRNLKKSLLEEERNKTGRLQMEELTSEQKNHLHEFILKKTSATDEDWETLLQNTLSVAGYLNEFNISGKIMGFCSHFKNLNLAKSYLGYMKKHGKKFNQVIVVEFLKTCYECEPMLTDVDLKVVRKFTDYLINNFEVMDEKVGSATVKGLCILNDWEKCIKFIDNLEKILHPSGKNVYSPLIVCLFKNQEFELGRKIIMENLSKKKKLTSMVYFKWIEISQNDPDRLEQLLVVFKDYNVIPKKFVCDYLIKIYSQLPSKHQREGEYTTIKFNGQCKTCKKTLEKNLLFEDEFNQLQDAFLNRVLFGNDVFMNTTPAEVHSFYKVVKAYAPFDVVIDGLNVMFTAKHKDVSKKSKELRNVVKLFFERNQKIFVVGRKHMKNIPKHVMVDIMEMSTVFLIDNESKDDPFIIYSSLFSGPKCCFVSNDYYRSEKFRLKDDRLSDLFKRWQLSHQIMIPQSSDRKFQPPLQFRLCAQKTTSQNWHIPYQDDDYTGGEQYEKNDLTKWLCLRRQN